MVHREYNVIVHKDVDLAELEQELCAAFGNETIPDREVEIVDPRYKNPRITSFNLSDDEAEQLRADPRILEVEIPPLQQPGMIVERFVVTTQSGDFDRSSNTADDHVNWGLRRVIETTNTFGGSTTIAGDYSYSRDGTGVDFVVMDSGIQADHPEFEDADGNSRVRQIDWYDAADIPGTMPTNFYTDFEGHGTHCAAIAAGKTYGWAKNADIYSFKMAGLEGPTDPYNGINYSVIFDLVVAWHNRKNNPADPIYTGRPTVMNMSWGFLYQNENEPDSGEYRGTPWTFGDPGYTVGTTLWNSTGIVPKLGNPTNGYKYKLPGTSTSANTDIDTIASAGIIVTISAGNNYYKNTLPGDVEYDNSVSWGAITRFYHRQGSPYSPDVFFVGSIDTDQILDGTYKDRVASSSTRGPAVNIFSPGDSIASATSTVNSYASLDVYNYIPDTNFRMVELGGTSMAAPQVAGIAALHLQANPNLTPAQIQDRIINDNSYNVMYSTGSDTDYTAYTSSLLGAAGNVVYSKYSIDVNESLSDITLSNPSLVTTNLNQPATINLRDLTSNVAVTNFREFTVTTTPTNGTVTLIDPSQGTVEYTPNTSYTGPDNFSFTLKNNLGNVSTNQSDVSVQVGSGQLVTVADDSFTTFGLETTVLDVLANDGINANVSTVVVDTSPSNGTASPNIDGTIDYTSSIRYGLDSFTYTVDSTTDVTSDISNVTVYINQRVAVSDFSFEANSPGTSTIPVLKNSTSYDPHFANVRAIYNFISPSLGTAASATGSTYLGNITPVGSSIEFVTTGGEHDLGSLYFGDKNFHTGASIDSTNLAASNFFTSPEWTVEWSFKISSSSVTGTQSMMCAKSVNNGPLRVFFNGTGLTCLVSSSSSIIRNFQGLTGWVYDDWNKIAIQRNNDSLAVFINGVLVREDSTLTSLNNISETDSIIYLGRDAFSTTSYKLNDCYMDNIRFTASARYDIADSYYPATQTFATSNSDLANVSTLTIAEQPTYGTAVLDLGNAAILYTADEGYVGADSFKYNVTSLNPTLSGNAIVTLEVSGIGTYDTMLVSPASVDEDGSTVTFTINTAFVLDGTTVGYTVGGTGITVDDISLGSLTGTINVNSNQGTLALQVLTDNLTEGAETLTLTLDATDSAGWATNSLSNVLLINDTSLSKIYDSLDVSPVSVDEDGSNVTFTVNTTNVTDATTIGYTISGTGITTNDISLGSLTGSITITANEGTLEFQVLADTFTEGPETLILTLDANDSFGTSTGSLSNTVTINDTSVTAGVYNTSTFNINSVNEDSDGDNTDVIFTVNTTAVLDGTTVGYTISGTGITVDDISLPSLTGSITINSNTGSVSFNVIADNLTEGNETLILTLDATDSAGWSTGGLSDTVLLVDTSVNDPIYDNVYFNLTNVDEDASTQVVFTVDTSYVIDGTTIGYTVGGTGITVNDISLISLTGDFTIINNTDSIDFTVNTDSLTEGNETLTITLDAQDSVGTNTGSLANSIILNDTSQSPLPGTPTYNTVGFNFPTVNEDGTTIVIFTINTTDVVPGTTVPYTISGGGITTDDLNLNSLTGDIVIVQGNIGQLAFTVSQDFLTEGPEILTVTLGATDSNGDPTGSLSAQVTLIDTSKTPAYLSAAFDVDSITENGTDFAVFRVDTENVAVNTEIGYVITGVGSGDISVPLTGNIFINNTDYGILAFTATEDFTTDGNMTATVTLVAQDSFGTFTGGLSDSVIIIDTSKTPNTPPTATSVNTSTGESTTIIIDLSGNISDSGPSSGLTALNIVTPPDFGTANVTFSLPDAYITYTPNPGFYGTDIIAYNVTDNEDTDSNTAFVTIRVFQAPIAANNTVTMNQAEVETFDILSNDSPGEGALVPTLTVIETVPSNGTVINNLDGTITYTPFSQFFGIDTLTYNITNSNNATSLTPGTVTITVNQASPPVAEDDEFIGLVNTAFNINVVSNDLTGNDPIDLNTLIITVPPVNGAAIYLNDGTITYTPNTGFIGVDTLSYTISDTVGRTSNPANVTITISGPDALLLHTVNNENAYGSSVGDNFGEVVAMSDRYSIVGAPNEDDDNGTSSGKAYIFNNTTGELLHTLVNPNPDNLSINDYFGSAVGITDNYAIVGSYGEDATTGVSPGRAYIYNAFTGLLLHTISDPSPPYEFNNFGQTVAITDNYFIVGDPTFTQGGASSGIVYVYDLATATLLHTIINPNLYYSGSGDRFGSAIAMTDTYFVVGAPGEDATVAPLGDTGIAYIYNTVTGAQLYTLENPANPGTQDLFGSSVAITNDYAVIGAPRATGDSLTYSGIQWGAAYIFNTSTGALLHTLDNPEESALPMFMGSSVAIDNVRTLVSVPDGNNQTGIVHVYDTATGSYLYAIVDPNADINSRFGNYVGLSDNYSIVTSPGSVLGGIEGAVYIFLTTVGINTAPISVNDSITTFENDTVIIDVLANDIDLENNIRPSTVRMTSTPLNGTAIVQQNGTIQYTPAFGYTGLDSFTYKVSDVYNLPASNATVSVDILQLPLAVNDSVTIEKNTIAEINLPSNDIGASIDPSSVTIISLPLNGIVQLDQPTGNVVYVPNTNWVGTDTFQYTIKNTFGNISTNIGTVTIIVEQPPGDGNIISIQGNQFDQFGTVVDKPVDVEEFSDKLAPVIDTDIQSFPVSFFYDNPTLLYSATSKPTYKWAGYNPSVYPRKKVTDRIPFKWSDMVGYQNYYLPFPDPVIKITNFGDVSGYTNDTESLIASSATISVDWQQSSWPIPPRPSPSQYQYTRSVTFTWYRDGVFLSRETKVNDSVFTVSSPPLLPLGDAKNYNIRLDVIAILYGPDDRVVPFKNDASFAHTSSSKISNAAFKVSTYQPSASALTTSVLPIKPNSTGTQYVTVYRRFVDDTLISTIGNSVTFGSFKRGYIYPNFDSAPGRTPDNYVDYEWQRRIDPGKEWFAENLTDNTQFYWDAGSNDGLGGSQDLNGHQIRFRARARQELNDPDQTTTGDWATTSPITVQYFTEYYVPIFSLGGVTSAIKGGEILAVFTPYNMGAGATTYYWRIVPLGAFANEFVTDSGSFSLDENLYYDGSRPVDHRKTMTSLVNVGDTVDRSYSIEFFTNSGYTGDPIFADTLTTVSSVPAYNIQARWLGSNGKNYTGNIDKWEVYVREESVVDLFDIQIKNLSYKVGDIVYLQNDRIVGDGTSANDIYFRKNSNQAWAKYNSGTRVAVECYNVTVTDTDYIAHFAIQFKGEDDSPLGGSAANYELFNFTFYNAAVAGTALVDFTARIYDNVEFFFAITSELEASEVTYYTINNVLSQTGDGYVKWKSYDIASNTGNDDHYFLNPGTYALEDLTFFYQWERIQDGEWTSFKNDLGGSDWVNKTSSAYYLGSGDEGFYFNDIGDTTVIHNWANGIDIRQRIIIYNNRGKIIADQYSNVVTMKINVSDTASSVGINSISVQNATEGSTTYTLTINSKGMIGKGVRVQLTNNNFYHTSTDFYTLIKRNTTNVRLNDLIPQKYYNTAATETITVTAPAGTAAAGYESKSTTYTIAQAPMEFVFGKVDYTSGGSTLEKGFGQSTAITSEEGGVLNFRGFFNNVPPGEDIILEFYAFTDNGSLVPNASIVNLISGTDGLGSLDKPYKTGTITYPYVPANSLVKRNQSYLAKMEGLTLKYDPSSFDTFKGNWRVTTTPNRLVDITGSIKSVNTLPVPWSPSGQDINVIASENIKEDGTTANPVLQGYVFFWGISSAPAGTTIYWRINSSKTTAVAGVNYDGTQNNATLTTDASGVAFQNKPGVRQDGDPTAPLFFPVINDGTYAVTDPVIAVDMSFYSDFRTSYTASTKILNVNPAPIPAPTVNLAQAYSTGILWTYINVQNFAAGDYPTGTILTFIIDDDGTIKKIAGSKGTITTESTWLPAGESASDYEWKVSYRHSDSALADQTGAIMYAYNNGSTGNAQSFNTWYSTTGSQIIFSSGSQGVNADPATSVMTIEVRSKSNNAVKDSDSTSIYWLPDSYTLPSEDVPVEEQPTTPATPPPTPVIKYFFWEPATIEVGQSNTLYWSVSNATSVEVTGDTGTYRLSGSGSRVNGPYKSAGNFSTTLTAYKAGAVPTTATATAPITVTAGPSGPEPSGPEPIRPPSIVIDER